MDEQEEMLAQWWDELEQRQHQLDLEIARYRLAAGLKWPDSYMVATPTNWLMTRKQG